MPEQLPSVPLLGYSRDITRTSSEPTPQSVIDRMPDIAKSKYVIREPFGDGETSIGTIAIMTPEQELMCAISCSSTLKAARTRGRPIPQYVANTLATKIDFEKAASIELAHILFGSDQTKRLLGSNVLSLFLTSPGTLTDTLREAQRLTFIRNLTTSSEPQDFGNGIVSKTTTGFFTDTGREVVATAADPSENKARKEVNKKIATDLLGPWVPEEQRVPHLAPPLAPVAALKSYIANYGGLLSPDYTASSTEARELIAQIYAKDHRGIFFTKPLHTLRTLYGKSEAIWRSHKIAGGVACTGVDMISESEWVDSFAFQTVGLTEDLAKNAAGRLVLGTVIGDQIQRTL